MAIRINDDFMMLEIGDRVVAAVDRFSPHEASNGHGAWVVSTCPARLLDRDQAITALTVAELLETGYPDGHPLVVALQEELR
jgi:hypothetical protein